jgi:hypothetical protein
MSDARTIYNHLEDAANKAAGQAAEAPSSEQMRVLTLVMVQIGRDLSVMRDVYEESTG